MGMALEDVDLLVRELAAAADAGEWPARATDRLFSLSGEVATTRDARLISATRARFKRLSGHVERGELGTEAREVGNVLSGLILSLSAALTAADMAGEANRRAAEVRTLKERILLAMRGRPVRPKALARELGVDESQISRAFRALVSVEAIERTKPPPNEPDARAHWYALARSPSAVGVGADPASVSWSS